MGVKNIIMFKFLKKISIFKIHRNNSGIIIYVVLWVLVILTGLALSVGRNTQIGLALTRHAIGKLRSQNLAEAAVSFSEKLIRDDSIDPNSSEADTRLYCGITKEDSESLEELFKKKKMADGFTTIFYLETQADESLVRRYGLQDQERFIDINTFTEEQQAIFIDLITLFGFDEKVARIISASVLDWRDADSVVTRGELGGEDDYYAHLENPYHCKNKPFDSIEELLLVKGMTREIFEKIKDYIAVFPQNSNFQINFDTAPEKVLQACLELLSQNRIKTMHIEERNSV